MSDIEEFREKIFDDIKHIDEYGNEYWEARELQQILGYKEWRYFSAVIEKAQVACSQSNNNINSNFGVNTKIVKTGVSSKVIRVKNFDKFTNAGYRGLYNGESADDIAKRKKLRYREEILDNMGSEELGANVFRITQTEALLKKQKEKNEDMATDLHYTVGKTIRDAIEKLGGTMPEDLPTPDKSLKEIEEEKNIKTKQIQS